VGCTNLWATLCKTVPDNPELFRGFRIASDPSPTTMEDVFKIGKKLKHLREERRSTQEAVAIDLGLKLSTYSDYEREISQVPAEVVVKASAYYKVDLSYFYSLRGPVSITMNDHASNGYVEHQSNVPQDLMERFVQASQQRENVLMEFMRGQLEAMKSFFDRQSGKQGPDA